MPNRTQREILRVAAGVIRRNGRVLIARRQGPADMAGLWEFPGGKIEPGELPEECLARELQEELGIAASVGALLHRMRHRSRERTVEVSFYHVSRPRGRVKLCDHSAFAWVVPEDLPAFPWVPADADFAARLARGAFS
jgi:mutator protein MutT